VLFDLDCKPSLEKISSTAALSGSSLSMSRVTLRNVLRELSIFIVMSEHTSAAAQSQALRFNVEDGIRVDLDMAKRHKS
jgi:hypothetical protein